MTCAICGRKLKDPMSMERGYGPVCYERAFGHPAPAKERIRRKKSQSTDDIPYYDIPGQMTLDDYLWGI